MKKVKYESVDKTEKFGTIEKSIKYVRVTNTPSMFRSYPHITEIMIRGQFFDEVLAISKITEEYTISKAVDIYRDCIKFNDSSFRLEDLELSDFILCCTISNIQTNEDFSWRPNIECNNIVENPLIKQYKINIKDVEDSIKRIDEKISTFNEKEQEDAINYKKEYKELMLDYNEKIKNIYDMNNEISECKCIISTPITAKDLDFLVDDELMELPYNIDLDGIPVQLNVLRVSDYIFFENNHRRLLAEFKNISEETIKKALYIKNRDFTFEQKLDSIRYSRPSAINKLDEFISLSSIVLSDLHIPCPQCRKDYTVRINLETLKVYP
jgi:hypothetical protein